MRNFDISSDSSLGLGRLEIGGAAETAETAQSGEMGGGDGSGMSNEELESASTPKVFGDLSPAALDYVQRLQSELTNAKEELKARQQDNVQLEHDRGHRNDLLEYLIPELELAEKTSEEEEEDSDSSSDSFDNASAFGEEELIAYAKSQDNRDPYADSDSDHPAEEEERLLFERHQEEWIRSGKAREVENLLELRKNFLCNLCLGKGHSSGVCPYLDGIPEHIGTLPPGYSIMCKRCHKIVEQSCHHGDEARCALRKHCVNCGQWGDHWVRVPGRDALVETGKTEREKRQ